MSFLKQNWIWTIPALILWGLFSLFFARNNPDGFILFRGFLFSFSITAALFFIQTKLVPKLANFSLAGQIFFKTVLYIVSILATVSLVFILFAFYSLSEELIIGEMIVRFANTVTLILLSPFSEVSTGDFIPQRIEYLFYILIFSFVIIGLGSVLISFIQTRWTHDRNVAQINEAQIKVLQTQIQPHFLFNTLSTIVSLVRENPAKAEELLLDFSDFYRFSFGAMERKTITLNEEVVFITNYLSLLKARFGDFLTWEIQLDDQCKKTELPVMILQPIVENAIKHGWQEKKEHFEILLQCAKNKNNFEITIRDNGIGFHLDTRKDFPPRGHALYLIRQRLTYFYHQKNLIKFQSFPDKGTTIKINIPA
ncbi:MAG: hypothetical protein D8M58_10410 [Calditrichaeota bacterium]|nr:MAG: hypothetical protein DWQ03_09785 [Calditrichota bacterium]MBL1205802.1 hypothetical protein [Calditrichota bacterium]NOG45630.1 histidine kinase [Calditrichota bacterium]